MGQPEHAVRFVPVQFMLNIHGRLGLNDKGDERQDEKEGGVEVFLSGLSFWVVVVG